MYAYLIFHMRGEFFDALVEEWVRATFYKLDTDAEMPDFDLAYCGGGPL